jgi:porphobilinogen synthase
VTPIRLRRLRRTPAIRAMLREHHLRHDQLVQPLFVVEEERQAGPLASMPGVFRFSVGGATEEAKALFALGIPAVLLFGIPKRKDATGSSNAEADGVVQRAIRAIKAAQPEMIVVADLCNCEYTDHGHCGILDDAGNVDNDASVAWLVRVALTYAQSGVDVIAPSDMMDGRVEAIRSALDAHSYSDVAILAYSAKYASAFYGPFREAAESTPQFGDRRGYQMDPPNLREALREIALDIEEGADAVMIKPGLPYLDVVRAARDAFEIPLAVYSVSGEYAMLKAAIANGWLEERAVDEALVAFVRAGADFIITYFAKEWAARNPRAPS